MPHIAIISSSVRTGRASHHVARYFERFITAQNSATVEIVDLLAYNFPLFDERLSRQANPDAKAVEFAQKIKEADGVLVVTPEYNGGYPASLKNAIDFLYDEWHRKPVAISTVSNGIFGGSQVITSLQFTLWKMRAWTVPAMFPVPKVQEVFDEDGNALQAVETDKRATAFLQELLWCMEAKKRMTPTSSNP